MESVQVDVELARYRARTGPGGAWSDCQVDQREVGTWAGNKGKDSAGTGLWHVLDPECQSYCVVWTKGTHTFLVYISSSPTRRSYTQCPRMR
jgi:hypothetical protein